MKHVFLIDGSGFLFRAYFGVKIKMSRPDGTPTNAVYGFTQMLMKLVDDTDADHIAVIFDQARKDYPQQISESIIEDWWLKLKDEINP